MNRLFLLASSICISVSSFAQWTKPAAPEQTGFVADKECYLYNRDADGFYVGGNDWGTRASISQTHGYKVTISKYIDENNLWDYMSYYISSYVENGNMKDQIGYTYINENFNIWVDNTINGSTNNLFTIEEQLDKTFKIGLSFRNTEYNSTTYKNTYLGVLTDRDDTRIYACSPTSHSEENGYDFSKIGFNWYLVEADKYEAYVEAVKRYNSATELCTLIDSAKNMVGIEDSVITTAESIYNDLSSVNETLNEAINNIKQAMYEVRLSNVSLENPIEVLSMYGTVEQTFTNGLTTGWVMNTSAANKQADNGNNAKDFEVTGNHLENWNAEAFGEGTISAKLTGIKNGVYKLQTLAFTNKVGETYVFAGENKTLLESTQIDIEDTTEVITMVSNNEIEFGLSIEEDGPNWVGLDNVNLYYLGESFEAYKLLAENRVNTTKDYETAISEGQIVFYCKPNYASYKEIKDTLQKSTTTEEVIENFKKFVEAANNMQSDITAYEKYNNLYLEASAWANRMATEAEDAMNLISYVSDETNEGFNGNGSAHNILDNCLLNAEDIMAEYNYFDAIYKKAVATGMQDGDECTSLLLNPNFAEEGGWTSTVGPTWPMGDKEYFPVFQAYNMVCDIYQNLSGLQNGLYEMTLEAGFRPGATYTEENEEVAKAYAYINSYETKIPCVEYNSADEASEAFAEHMNTTTAYGLVTDGTMKIGFTNKVRSVENCVLWGGGVKLTFRGKNEEVLKAVIKQAIPSAKETLNTSYCGQAEKDALDYAVHYADKEDDLFESLINLKEAEDAVNRGNELYNILALAIDNLGETISKNKNADSATIIKATSKLNETTNYWNNQSYNNAQAETALSEINEAIVQVKIAGLEIGDKDSIDYTEIIINPKFDPTRGKKDDTYIDGWRTTAMNGYKENSVSYNRTAFELNQTINGLKKGNYKVKVYTYYRAGYWYEEEALKKEGKETHLTTLYAKTNEQTFSTPVINLTEGATEEKMAEGNCYTLTNGLYAPDGTTPSVEYFSKGYYLNELEFTLNEVGSVTIGLSKQEIIANDYEVVGGWELWYFGGEEEIPADPSDPIDYTKYISNSDFDPNRGNKDTNIIEGWVTSDMTGYKKNTVFYNRSEVDLFQNISGLPVGTYKVGVNAYYRAGFYNEEEIAKDHGRETYLADLYVKTTDNNYSVHVKNLCDGASENNDITEGNTYTLSSGKYVPDGTVPSVDYFEAGKYKNEIAFYTKDGSITIGIKKTETLANDYLIVGKWCLYYYGKGDYVDQISEPVIYVSVDEVASVISPVAYYSVSGTRLDAPQKGINIVKMSNNTFVKMMVK